MEEFNSLIDQIGKEAFIAMLVVNLIFLILWLILGYQTRRLVLMVKEENRFLSPGQAWVFAVPLVNIFYNFVLIRRITDSLNNEFYDRREAVDEDPTLKQGYYMSFAYLAANFPLPSFVAYAVMLISFVYYINYIAKIVEYRKLLELPPPVHQAGEEMAEG